MLPHFPPIAFDNLLALIDNIIVQSFRRCQIQILRIIRQAHNTESTD